MNKHQPLAINQQHVKDFINNAGVFNVSGLCKLAEIDRFHAHKFLSSKYELNETQIAALVAVLKIFGYSEK